MSEGNTSGSLTKPFLVGFLLMTSGGVLWFVRDAMIDRLLYNLWHYAGLALCLVGFGLMALSMAKHWAQFFKNKQ